MTTSENKQPRNSCHGSKMGEDDLSHCSFEETLKWHLEAIQTRCLDMLMQTVDSEVSLIMGNGAWYSGSEAFQKVHEDWFSDTDWRLEACVKKREESSEQATVLFEVIYHDLDSQGQEVHFSYWLTLVFQKKSTGWKLCFDQNTPGKSSL